MPNNRLVAPFGKQTTYLMPPLENPGSATVMFQVELELELQLVNLAVK